MIVFIALIVIVLIYIVPFNIILYSWSRSIAAYIIAMPQMDIPDNKFIQAIAFIISKNTNIILTSLMYILFVVYIFAILRFILYLTQRWYYLKEEKDIYEIIDSYIEKYSVGLSFLNSRLRIVIIIMAVILILFKVYDIRVYVFAALLLLFGFKNYKKKVVKKNVKEKVVDKRYKNFKSIIKEESKFKYEKLSFKYNIDPLCIEEPIVFEVKFIVGYKGKEDEELSKDESIRSIKELANQIKNSCIAKELGYKHMISVVFSLVKDFKILEKNEEKTNIIEVIKSKSGNEKEIIIFSALILSNMGFDVKEFERPLKDGSKKPYLYVSGADLEESNNYYKIDDKKYYQCELLLDGDYYVGELNIKMDSL